MSKYSNPDKSLQTEEKAFIEALFRGRGLDHMKQLKEEEFQRLLNYSRRNGMAPLLFSILQKDQLPEATQLKSNYLSSYLRNEAILNVAHQSMLILSDAGINAVFIKGSFLATNIYSEPALRPMSDIDILVEPGKAEKAHELLCAAEGYQKTLSTKDHDLTYHHLSAIVFKGISIELHRSLLPTNSKYGIPNKDVWENMKIQGNIKYIDPNLHFIYLVLHIYYTMQRGGIRLSWFYDLQLLLNNEFFHPDESGLRYWVTRLKVQKPVSEISEILAWLIQGQSKTWINSLIYSHNPKSVRTAALLFRNSEQQVIGESYSLIWERFFKIKGLKNKLQFVWIHLKNDPKNPNSKVSIRTLSVRILKISTRTISMIIRRITNTIKR